MRPWMEKWGSVLLIFFCALVILFSALYTRQEDVKRLSAQNATASQDETLSSAARYSAPAAGEIMQGYRGAYKTDGGLWRFDPFVHYSVQKGAKVLAVSDGNVALCNNYEIILFSKNNYLFRLKGDFSPIVSQGDTVASGQVIATVTQAGELLLSVSADGHYFDPLSLFTP